MVALPFSRYHMLVPELARVPPDREVLGIPAACVGAAVEQLRPLLPLPVAPHTVTDLYLVAHSSRIADRRRYLAQLGHQIAATHERSQARVVAVKAHPRETDVILLSSLEATGAVVFPHWLPAELVVPSLRPDVDVHCGLSTFIVSSLMLMPRRRIHLDPSTEVAHADILRAWDPSIMVGDASTVSARDDVPEAPGSGC